MLTETQQGKLEEFWRFLSRNLGEMKLEELREDLLFLELTGGLKDWRERHARLRSSGVVYLMLLDRLAECLEVPVEKLPITLLFQSGGFELKVPECPLLEERIKRNFGVDSTSGFQKVLVRFWVILTTKGKLSQAPLLEEVYNSFLRVQESLEFPLDWQVVKWLPATVRAEEAEPIYCESLLSWRVSFSEGELSLWAPSLGEEGEGEALPAPLVVKNLLTTNLTRFLGEFLLAERVKKITLFTFPPGEAGELRAFGELFQLLREKGVFSGSRGCGFCSLRSENTRFFTVDHSRFNTGVEDLLPEGEYCEFCFRSLKHLFLS